MHLVWRHQSDAQMMMIAIVPVEELTAKSLGVLDAAEPFGKLWLIFHRLEVAFREGIVIGGIGPAVRFGDAEIGEQERGGLGFHGRPAVRMQGQLARRNVMPGSGVLKQRLEKGGAFRVGDAPTNDPSAENVDDHVKVEIGPFLRAHQFTYIP